MNALAISGIGAITPAGAGWAGLAAGACLERTDIPSLHHSGHAFSVLGVNDAMLQRWAREPRLRRASRITHLMAETASQALGGHSPKRLGIVGAFFTGPCHASRLFFQPVLQQGPSFASPALFPETVYNSSLSHIANLFGAEDACYAAVGDDSAWVTALQVASTWLDLGTADHVLVIGAEELDASAIEAYAAAGWLKKGMIPSEGAAALLLSRPTENSAIVISGLLEGFSYRSKSSARNAIVDCHAAMTDAPVLGCESGVWMDALSKEFTHGRVSCDVSRLGHAFTATAGWNTLLGIQWLLARPTEGNLWVPIFGLHHQVSALRLHFDGRHQLAVFGTAG